MSEEVVNIQNFRTISKKGHKEVYHCFHCLIYRFQNILKKRSQGSVSLFPVFNLQNFRIFSKKWSQKAFHSLCQEFNWLIYRILEQSQKKGHKEVYHCFHCLIYRFQNILKKRSQGSISLCQAFTKWLLPQAVMQPLPILMPNVRLAGLVQRLLLPTTINVRLISAKSV